MDIQLSPENILKLIAIIGTGIAMVTDMTKGKIYNWLTFPLIFAGWLLNLHFFGLKGLGYSVAATFLGFLIYIIPATFGLIGMGDVKLMGAVGALCGTNFTINTFLFTSALGIPHAIIIQLLNYGSKAFLMLITSFSTKAFLDKTIQKENKESEKKYKFFLGIDIFIATIISTFFAIQLKF